MNKLIFIKSGMFFICLFFFKKIKVFQNYRCNFLFSKNRQIIFLLFCFSCLGSNTNAQIKKIIDFDNGFIISTISTRNASVSLVNGSSGKVLKVVFSSNSLNPSINFKISPTGRDLSAYYHLNLDIHNIGVKDITIQANIWGWYWIEGLVVVHPDETQTLSIAIPRKNQPNYLKTYLPTLNGFPGGDFGGCCAADNVFKNVTDFTIAQFSPKEDAVFEISNIRAEDTYNPPTETSLQSDFFPFIDQFGQYKHKEWAGKVKTTTDIVNQYITELDDLAANPGPLDRDQYGGWTKGPKLTASGHFRVEKYQGKWWFVDPDGYLFWSSGIDCIVNSIWSDGAVKCFDTPAPNADFLRANLLKKYGNNWLTMNAELIFKRLKSWGVNTTGNWSAESFYLQHKTPYVVALISDGVAAATNTNSIFRIHMANAMFAQLAKSANDPWCIGYFVDNEISNWGDGSQLTLETYFKSVSEEIKKVAPNKLYLGSRIGSPFYTGVETGTDNDVVKVSAKYVDVITFNRYRFDAIDLGLPVDIDKPILVGEFHFGALDRGLPHPGLRSTYSQEQRGRTYENYVRTALDNSNVIGVHWFQYFDEPYTGRGDGENYQIGFVDVTDKPYPEIISASRRVNYNMYELRANGIVNSLENSRIDNSREVLIYPNPASESLFIKIKFLTEETGSMQITITDLQGRYVFNSVYSSQTSNLFKIDIKSIKSGLYILTIKKDDFFYYKKFTKI